MDETLIPDLGFDWNQLLELLQSKGIDFGINLLIALHVRLLPNLNVILHDHFQTPNLRRVLHVWQMYTHIHIQIHIYVHAHIYKYLYMYN